MKSVFYAISILWLPAIFYPVNSFSQNVSVLTPFDYDAQISDIALNLSNYHWNLSQEALARGDQEEAERHSNLAGMSLAQIGVMVRATLSEENKQKLIESGPENCIIESNATVTCLN